jgi:hypothetical protein
LGEGTRGDGPWSPKPHKGVFRERMKILELFRWHRRLACARKRRGKCLFVRADVEEKRKEDFVRDTIKDCEQDWKRWLVKVDC